MTRDTTATTVEQHRPESGEQTPEAQDESSPDDPDASSGPEPDPPEVCEVSINGEIVAIEPDTTVGELRETVGIGSENVFTYRSPDGIEALTDGDVVANHVDDGDEIQTQPIADSEVFGEQ